MLGNTLQISPNHVKLRENVWERMWEHAEVTVTHCFMAYPYFWSLVMRGNMFKHDWNNFCQREKYINIHIVYEHTYFFIFIMILLSLMLVTAGHI